MPLTSEMKAGLLWDKHAVSELMLQFGRALDQQDWALYRSCFADSVQVDFQQLTGFGPATTSADLWTRFAQHALKPWLTHHQYSNISVTVERDRASAVIYMVARHAKAQDSRVWNSQYGWYRNRFERCAAHPGWRITHLTHEFQWIAGVPDLLDADDPEVSAILGQIFCESPGPGS